VTPWLDDRFQSRRDKMKYVLALIVTLALTGAAPAQHAHGNKGPNGGQLQDVAGVHAELVISGSTITVNILDEDNKPVGTKGFAASALVVRGAEREAVALAPAGESALKGDAKKPVAGAAITVTLKTAAGKSGQAKYKP
jgi:nitrogen fixation protein FixH